MKVPELKAWLRGKKINGKKISVTAGKDKLIERIKNYIDAVQEESITIKSSGMNMVDLHIKASTFNFSNEVDSKVRSLHSKIGYRERIKSQQMNLIDIKNKKLRDIHEEEIRALTCSGLFCCKSYDETTRNRCLAGPFLTKGTYERHQQMCEKGLENHVYPSVDSKTQITIDVTNGKWALSLACGTMTNKDRAVAPDYPIKACKDMPKDSRIFMHATKCGVYRRDNKEWRKKQFKATPELNSDLEALYLEGEDRSSDNTKKTKASKYTASEAVSVLRNMIGKDGHRKYRSEGQFGPVPDIAYVKSRFSRMKNLGAKDIRIEEKYESRSLSDLKKEYKSHFGKSVTEKSLCINLLEIDDTIKYGGHDNQYSLLNTDQLKTECINRKLPIAIDIPSLITVLQAHEKCGRQKVRSSSKVYKNALDLAEASAKVFQISNDK